MKTYGYMCMDVGTDETHIENQVLSYADNTFIQQKVSSTFNTGQHTYNYIYYPQEIDYTTFIGRTFPKDQTNGEGEIITMDNPHYLLKDLNTRENGTPIYIHLD